MSKMMLVVGIIFTILSVFISYYVINKAQVKVDALRVEISLHEDKINASWRKQQELEQRHAMSVMLYALVVDRSSGDPARIAACNYVDDTMSYHDIKMDENTCSGVGFLSEKLKELQLQTIDDINDLYTEKLSLESAMIDLQKSSEIAQAVALLMQVIGLIFVLYFKP